jgi:hypothetical protein
LGSHAVAALNIFGTLHRVSTYCGKDHQKMVFSWGESSEHPEGSKEQYYQTAIFCAHLFLQKYEPTASWEMDDNPRLWNLAVLDIARQSPARFPYQVETK